MKKKRLLRLKKKVFPFPVLILGIPFYLGYLYGDEDSLSGLLFMLILFLGLWYFLGPDLEAPSFLGVKHGRLVDPAFLPPLDANGAMQDVQLRLWTKHLYEDQNYRSGVLALALAGLLIGTALFTYFNDDVIRRRANLLIGLCVLGLLTLVVLALLRRLFRGREQKDRAAYPTPAVNMNYDHDAVADSRVRALHQRLERLEEWKNSGLIGKEEFEKLRKKYLNQHENR